MKKKVALTALTLALGFGVAGAGFYYGLNGYDAFLQEKEQKLEENGEDKLHAEVLPEAEKSTVTVGEVKEMGAQDLLRQEYQRYLEAKAQYEQSLKENSEKLTALTQQSEGAEGNLADVINVLSEQTKKASEAFNQLSLTSSDLVKLKTVTVEVLNLTHDLLVESVKMSKLSPHDTEAEHAKSQLDAMREKSDRLSTLAVELQQLEESVASKVEQK